MAFGPIKTQKEGYHGMSMLREETEGNQTSGVLPRSHSTLDLEDLQVTTPAGFETVPGWWATREAEALDLLADPAETFTLDAEKLEILAGERTFAFYWVVAPLILQKIGVALTQAFPVELLTSFYS